MRKNCSCDQENFRNSRLKTGQEFANILRSLVCTIFEKEYFFILSLMLKAKIAGVSADRIEVRISKTFVINFQKNEFTLKSC